ncbi:hypothetical protein AVEN_9282-1 [Araneus ventricosus]|uniref:Uncharacterized protein n=1 Tax=Araneus ventricosus TaxID=182803 RepID=A0A4Y2MS17_ARAVE|nr:hypothetical protein AVEN_9282-1 [Araneus ventricosus]
MLPRTREKVAINGLTSIGYNKLTVEALRRKVSPGQCFKCQQYFHNSRSSGQTLFLRSVLDPTSREMDRSPVRPVRSRPHIKLYGLY